MVKSERNSEAGAILWANPLVRLGAGIIVCIAIATFLALQWLFNPDLDADPSQFHHIVGHYSVMCLIWGLLSIGIKRFTDRVGLDRRRWLRCLLLYVLGGIVFSLAYSLIASVTMSFLDWVMGIPPRHRNPGWWEFAARIQSNAIMYSVITIACLAIGYYQKFRERELRSSRLESQLSQARLDVLKSQLRPHFLFNSLNAVLALVRENPKAAEKMLLQLSSLLRATLDSSGKEFVSLEDELEFVRSYLEIERTRFGERLQVNESIDDNCLSIRVPHLLLQPLVENSIVHAVARQSQRCTVSIEISKNANRLRIRIQDDGPGESTTVVSDLDSRAHVGLGNTRNRLHHLYGAEFQLEAGNRPDSQGFRVDIEIPTKEPDLS